MDSFGFLFIEPEPHRDVPASGYVYVKSGQPLYGRPYHGTRLLTRGSATWEEFSQELDRLQRELEDMRREAQLRFAGSSAKRYGAAPARLRVVRGNRSG